LFVKELVLENLSLHIQKDYFALVTRKQMSNFHKYI